MSSRGLTRAAGFVGVAGWTGAAGWTDAAGWIAASVTTLLAGSAWAAPSPGPPEDGPSAAKADEAPPEFNDYWSEAPTRAFVAAAVGLGPLSKASLLAGYGKPHWMFVALETQAYSTFEFAATSAGLRADFLVLNASVDVRRTWAYSRRLPERAETFDDASLVNPTRPRSEYTAVDLLVWGYVPVGPTLGYWELTQTFFPDKPDDAALFEEWMRFTTNEGSATMGRFVWSYVFWDRRALVGPALDLAFAPGRSPVVRVGAAFDFQITTHLGVALYASAPVASPDSIGWFDQSWGIARLNWRWASGESRPGFD